MKDPSLAKAGRNAEEHEQRALKMQMQKAVQQMSTRLRSMAGVHSAPHKTLDHGKVSGNGGNKSRPGNGRKKFRRLLRTTVDQVLRHKELVVGHKKHERWRHWERQKVDGASGGLDSTAESQAMLSSMDNTIESMKDGMHKLRIAPVGLVQTQARSWPEISDWVRGKPKITRSASIQKSLTGIWPKNKKPLYRFPDSNTKFDNGKAMTDWMLKHGAKVGVHAAKSAAASDAVEKAMNSNWWK